ncbi:unnamed protein product [Phyllotreta striolata]|uniref:Gustatory receptor n=1 Tax=Phyllotreta striolata TaxID=444603 RepID=A0A9N9XLA8_PHYSR|nr:unnamed protein product [Phyllotreta striolata]
MSSLLVYTKILRITRYLGMRTNHKEAETTMDEIFKYFNLIITIIFCLCECGFIYLDQSGRTTDTVIFTLNRLNHIIFIFGMCYTRFKCTKTLNKFFTNMDHLADSLPENSKLAKETLLILLTTSAIGLNRIPSHFRIEQKTLNFLIWPKLAVTTVWYTVSMVCTCNMLDINNNAIKQTYRFLKQTPSNCNNSDFMYRLHYLKKNLNLISSNLKCFNKIFGWICLSLYLDFALNIIYALQITMGKQSFFPMLRWIEISQCTLHAVNAVTLVNKCDRIEKNIGKFVAVCYGFHQNIPDKWSIVREEMMNLGNYAEKTMPKCSAAGFFTLNRSTLGALFSSIATYLIVCIQFNMSEAQK